jgi:hypothetical protein
MKEYLLGGLIVLAFTVVPLVATAIWLGSFVLSVVLAILGYMAGAYFVVDVLEWD